MNLKRQLKWLKMVEVVEMVEDVESDIQAAEIV